MHQFWIIFIEKLIAVFLCFCFGVLKFVFEKRNMDSIHLYMFKTFGYDPCRSMFLIPKDIKPTGTILGSWLTQSCLQESAGFWTFTKPPPTSKLHSFLLRWPDVVWHGLCISLGLTWGIKRKKINEFDWSLHGEKEVKAVILNFSYIWSVRFKTCEKS